MDKTKKDIKTYFVQVEHTHFEVRSYNFIMDVENPSEKTIYEKIAERTKNLQNLKILNITKL